MTWNTLYYLVSNLAENMYDNGIKLLGSTRRSTSGHSTKYHRPRSLIKWRQSRSRMKGSTSSRRRRHTRSMLQCVLFAVASSRNATMHQCYASEISNINHNVVAMISKHKQSVKGDRMGPINARFDTDSFVLGFDCHATTCMTNNEARMINTREWKGGNLKGVGQARIAKIGTMVYNLEDNAGKKSTHFVPECLLVPNLPKDLLSPQHFAKYCNSTDTNKTVLVTGASGSEFHYGKDAKLHLTIPHSKRTNVPELRITTGCKAYHAFAANVESKSNIYKYEAYCSPCALPSTTAYSNPHDSQVIPAVVSDDESETDNMKLTKKGANAPNESTFVTNDEGATALNKSVHDNEPSTADSQISPDHTHEDENLHDLTQPSIRLPLQSNDSEVFASSDKGELLRYHYKFGHIPFKRLKLLAATGIIPKKLQHVKAPCCAACMFGKLSRRPWRVKGQKASIFQATAPGQCVSVDQMESTAPGFIAQLKGRITKRRYYKATVFVDHFSGYSYVHLQETLTSADTIKAKHAFEAHCDSLGVKVRRYHCDNGRFADNAFIQDTRKLGQTISFCGVNAHFQNGRAEKKIRDLRESSRTQLLHAINRWPGVCSIHLWGYSFRYANDVHNNLPIKADGSTPLNLFSGVKVYANPKDFHAFGCPVYALDNRLASGKSIGHWDPRCRIGLNLGFSPRHARTVSLVLNIHTGTVSPQFHIKHDDFFESVSAAAGNTATRSLWQSLAGFRRTSQKPPSTDTSTSDVTALPPRETAITGVPIMQPPTQPGTADDTARDIENTNQEGTEEEAAPPSRPSHISASFAPPSDDPTDDPTGDDSTTSVRRSSRARTATTKYKESVQMGLMSGFPAVSNEHDEEYYDALHQDDYRTQDKMNDPIAFLASCKKSGDPDTLYYHQAMAAPDSAEFKDSMLKEFHDHCNRRHWEPVAIENIPAGTKILDAIWSMRRKRDIKTREITKWKSRLTVHGGQQEHGVHYWETYAPVVNWFSTRLLLAQSIMHKWHTRQVDFVLAFPQAEPECDMYMKLPRGIQIPGMNNKTHALKLLRNLYGGRAASRIWVKYLSDGLKNMGFEQSAIDECVWYRGDIIFTFYIDDGIIWCPRKEGIDEFMKDIRDETKTGRKFDIEDRGDVSDYLGINIDQLKDGRVHLSQPQLINQVIKDVNVINNKPRPTPAVSTKILHRDLDGKPFDGSFDYASVIGKLNFLEKGSRPDIAYAVHQCARFSSAPRQSHGEAVRNIVKYLKGTSDKGIYFDPNTNASFEVYVDADFCGNWQKESAQFDQSTAKSRSGYVISLYDCPLIWFSKLQTQCALSTTEAEYIALSQSMRDALPIMRLLQELKDKGFDAADHLPKIHCKAFEDNSGALELANAPKMRPRTKHINLVYHHFQSFVRGPNPLVSIHPIDTLDQTGDIFTKPLDQNLFVKHRRKMMGW